MSPRSTDVDPRVFLPLSPLVFQVMLAIADQSRHGYGIILEVEARTAGLIRMKTGTLYVLLKRLVDQKLAEEAEARPRPKDDDARRRYYAVTPLGRAVLQAEARRLDNVLVDARRKRLLGRRSAS
jgi:DNA-binding PadR family transcriptional regulator